MQNQTEISDNWGVNDLVYTAQKMKDFLSKGD